MALPVNVSSVDVLKSAREAIILFTEEAKGSLAAMESEFRRCVDWLSHDQKMYWQSEVKRRQEKLSQAKAELHRKQLSQMNSGSVQDSDQREAVRNAKRQLEEAEEKVELIRRTLPVVEKAVMEYLGQARPFGDTLEFEVERSGGLLERMIIAIEEYSRVSAPITSSRDQVSTTAFAPMPANSSPASIPAPAVTEESKTELAATTEDA